MVSIHRYCLTIIAEYQTYHATEWGSFCFFNSLALKGINTILLAGYDLNSCLYENPIGLRNLGLAGFNVILVRDATVAIEYSAGTDAYDYYIAYIERDRASTADLNAFIKMGNYR